jgi:hypothetical protein
VANFETAYNAFMGRQSLTKFMAIPNYAYLVLKVPGPCGVISIRGDIKRAYDCNKESCEAAEVPREFHQKNRDIFAWKPADMPGVPRELIEHELHLDPQAKPINQRRRHFTHDQKDVIKKEIARLLDANLLMKCTPRIGLSIPFLYPKRIRNE